MKTYYSQEAFRYLFLLPLLLAHFNSSAQDVILQNQNAVNQFDPATTIVNGDLLIGKLSSDESNISNLNNLSNLTTVTGSLIIRRNPELVNLDGLNGLTSIGELDVSNNTAIGQIDALNNLTSIGGNISFYDNWSLHNVNGLNKLTSIHGYFYWW